MLHHFMLQTDAIDVPMREDAGCCCGSKLVIAVDCRFLVNGSNVRQLSPNCYGLDKEGALAEGAEATLMLNVTAPVPCGPSYCTLATQPPAISGLMLERYW